MTDQTDDIAPEDPEALYPFRWIGAGVLNINFGSGFSAPPITYRPGDLVKDVAHLAELGAARIRELVSSGQAEFVPADEELG